MIKALTEKILKVAFRQA